VALEQLAADHPVESRPRETDGGEGLNRLARQIEMLDTTVSKQSFFEKKDQKTFPD
jgi:hypothetical protein